MFPMVAKARRRGVVTANRCCSALCLHSVSAGDQRPVPKDAIVAGRVGVDEQVSIVATVGAPRVLDDPALKQRGGWGRRGGCDEGGASSSNMYMHCVCPSKPFMASMGNPATRSAFSQKRGVHPVPTSCRLLLLPSYQGVIMTHRRAVATPHNHPTHHPAYPLLPSHTHAPRRTPSGWNQGRHRGSRAGVASRPRIGPSR